MNCFISKPDREGFLLHIHHSTAQEGKTRRIEINNYDSDSRIVLFIYIRAVPSADMIGAHAQTRSIHEAANNHGISANFVLTYPLANRALETIQMLQSATYSPQKRKEKGN